MTLSLLALVAVVGLSHEMTTVSGDDPVGSVDAWSLSLSQAVGVCDARQFSGAGTAGLPLVSASEASQDLLPTSQSTAMYLVDDFRLA